MTGRLLRPAERGDCSSVVDTVQRANTAAQRRQAPNAAARRRLRHEAAGGRAAARALADRGRKSDQRRGDRRRLADVRADRNDAGAERRWQWALSAASIAGAAAISATCSPRRTWS